MKITWLGHAAFLLETGTSQGAVRVILDPYSPQIGYQPINEAAHVVTLSHDNPKWHSCLDDIHGEPQIVRGLDLAGHIVHVKGLGFRAVQVFEELDYETRQGDGPNAMIWLESEGLRVLHMGDVGHRLDDSFVAACGDVDVLLALAGGPPTIELDDLKDFIDRLRPRIVIPMHFAVPELILKLQPVEDFLALFPPDSLRYESSHTLTLTRDTLPPELTIHVLQHAR